MRKIILCVLLFASFIFALNCEPLTLCKAFNNKTRTETTIYNVLDKRRKTEYTYDDFWIAVKESNEFTSQTCADLYKQFKKEMK